jgi:ADP-ribose pyrophosphatase YjhB (NUDIX family)
VPGVSILVIDGDRIVLCRRRSASFGDGRWCLPCGYVEYDEDFLTAAVREVKEETGLDISVTRIVSVVTNYLTPGLHTLVVVMVAEPVGGDLVARDHDVDAVGWFAVSETLPELAFEADGHIIRRYFATHLTGAPVDPRFSGA